MQYSVDIVEAQSSQLAAVRAHADRSTLPSLIVSSLDQVYAFLETAPQLVRGCNVVVYDGRWNIEAGVQVGGSFAPSGNVVRTETPSGRAARTLHRGPYNAIGNANEALRVWCIEHGEQPTGVTWEVYGDWASDESELTTEIFYQLVPRPSQ